MNLRLISFVCLLCVVGSLSVSAQKATIKTNLLYDATATLNGAVEVRFSNQWTGELGANLNAWAINDHRWKHWAVQPEVRYWFCESFSGHSVGADSTILETSTWISNFSAPISANFATIVSRAGWVEPV